MSAPNNLPESISRVYMDNNSTTPVDPRVVDAMTQALRDNFGNPSSAHSTGANAAAAVEYSRRQVAMLVNADAEQVVFCSSATEAINTVVRGVGAGTLVTSSVEHAATLESAAYLRDRGTQVTTIDVDLGGMLDFAMLEKAVARRPNLVSLLWANNETGVLFPIEEIATLCESHGVPLHVDAVQAAGKIDIDFLALPITFLTISSHKIFGPKGVGAFVARDTVHMAPLLLGGGQERGLRAGTENVPGIVGFGVAASLAKTERAARVAKVFTLRSQLEEAITGIRKSTIYGVGSPRVANTSNTGFAGIDSNDLVAALDGLGISVSNGSACHSKSLVPSHVLTAMTGSTDRAKESIRLSLSHFNTAAEVTYVCNALVGALDTLR